MARNKHLRCRVGRYHLPMPPVLVEAPAVTQPSLLTRRVFLGSGAAAAAGLALYAGEHGRHQLELERRTIRIAHLPEAFAGFRIAQISDIHLAEYTEPGFVQEAVRRINALRPDLVLITGDYICMGPINHRSAEKYIPVAAELLGALQCPHRYGVLGNHDWMVNGDMIVDHMRAVGIPILHNSNLPIERGNARIWVAGIMDALSWESDVPASLPKHAADNEPVILMAHEPDILPAVAQLNRVDLMLSGHTHGGQVRLPFLPPLLLPPLGQRFVEGHFRMGRTQLYVNRGIGAVGLPFRFRCPSEITELTLQPA